MTPEDIQKAIHEGIAIALEIQLPLAVKTAVDSAVNGKVKALSDKMSPIADAYDKWLTWRRLALVIVGTLITFGSIISTAQEVWGLVTTHLVVK